MRGAIWCAALLLAACSGGQVGDKGLVRFSQVVSFAEAGDFKAPIAVDRTVLVALQHPNELGERTFPELRLVAEGPGTPGVFPLGFAQFAVVLNAEGDYRLLAKKGEATLDTLAVKARPLSKIRFSSRAELATHKVGDQGACVKTQTLRPEEIVLNRNQSARLFVVPVSDDDRPMLGLLQLTATGPAYVQLGSPLVGQGKAPNALTVEPAGTLGETAELVVKEEGALEVKIAIPTRDADAPVDCS